MTVCPRCGVAVAPTDPRCFNCGLARPDSPTTPATPAAGAFGQPTPAQPLYPSPYQPTYQPVRPEPPRRRTATVVLTSVAVVVLLAIASLAALWATDSGPFGPRDSGSAEAGPTIAPTVPLSVTAPTTSNTSADVPGDFSQVYARVQSGVGLVSVDTCDASYTGTGFLVAPDTLVTAAHVVEGATDVRVAFDGAPVDASVLGVDASLDLAVLSVQPNPGHHFVFDLAGSDPDTGTRIAVIGYPLGEPRSLTEGTISGGDRTITTESGTFTGMLQTDAAINPGNSGGPLLNDAGQIVGVADAIRKHAAGIGFAVPISKARGAIETGSGLRPQQTPECEQPPTRDEVATAQIQQTLTSYLGAINSGQYVKAMSLVSDTIRSDSSRAQWFSDYSTTYDDQLQMQSVSVGWTTAQVWATFRSQQAPGYGPSGAEDATCLLWSIDYTMADQGGGWIIDSVKGHQDPAWVRCD